MQRERALIGVILDRPVPVHADARQPRRRIELVADVRPPAVDAGPGNRPMLVPIMRGVVLAVRRGARVVDGAGQMQRRIDDMQRDAEIGVVQLPDHRRRIGKDALVEPKLPVPCVPSARREAGAEIDERVARQLPAPELARFVEHLLAALERAARLHVAERPERRQVGKSGNHRVFAHDLRRVARDDEERVELRRAVGRIRRQAAFLVAQVERSVRTMEEDRPAFRADDPGNGDARAFMRQVEFVVRRARAGLAHVDRLHAFALAVDQRKRAAAAVELMSTLTQAEDRAVASGEVDFAARVDPHALAWMARAVGQHDCERIRRHANPAAAPVDDPGRRQRTNSG